MNWVLDCIYCISFMKVVGISLLLHFCGAFSKFCFLSEDLLHVDRGPELVASVDGVITELLLDTEDLVELGETLGTGRGTSLDLTGAETNDDVGNGDILGLTRAVRNHDTPASAEGILGGLDGLSDGTDLVDLEEESVARLLLDGLLDELRVGDCEIITDDLEVGGLVEVRPGLPVVLSEGVLDGDDGVLLGEGLVELSELLVGEPLALVGLGVLEVKVVLLLVDLVELAGGNVHGDLDLTGVTGSLDGLGDEVKSLLGGLDIGSDTALVTDVAGGLAVLLLGKGLQLLVDLSTLAHGLGESGSLAVILSDMHLQICEFRETCLGTIMNSWKAMRPPAWEPPFRTFMKGTGRT